MTVKADGAWTLGRLVEGARWREIDHPVYRKALRVSWVPHDGEFAMLEQRARYRWLRNTSNADDPTHMSMMLDDPKTIRMTNLTKSLQDGHWNVEYWPGYGFTANNRTTTNGSLSFLLRCVNTPENQAAVMQFAREVAKIDQDAARQVASIDAARKQGGA